jgi:hypothetical protein
MCYVSVAGTVRIASLARIASFDTSIGASNNNASIKIELDFSEYVSIRGKVRCVKPYLLPPWSRVLLEKLTNLCS